MCFGGRANVAPPRGARAVRATPHSDLQPLPSPLTYPVLLILLVVLAAAIGGGSHDAARRDGWRVGAS